MMIAHEPMVRRQIVAVARRHPFEQYCLSGDCRCLSQNLDYRRHELPNDDTGGEISGSQEFVLGSSACIGDRIQQRS
ncbi:hypothetical protein, partial [uncultured Arthrobacter sp.]|uniref:hypothetical protein n=1 Tax=uncultured Arthrobacter sp. TaxID=114050 RepID=UPI003217509F